MTQFSGIRCRGEQGCNPLLTHNCIGGLFRFASERCGRAETPKGFDTVRNSSFLAPSAHPPLASSMQSKNNCGRFLNSRSCLCLPITFKICSGFSKISERRSSAIRFVHLRSDALRNTNESGRWRNRWRMTVRDSYR